MSTLLIYGGGLVAKSYLTLATPCTVAHPASSVHGISQARELEWAAISFFRGSSPPRDWTYISCIGRKFLYHWANITLPTKVCLVKAIVFPVVTYGCESWTRKKAEHWRIDAFELWCWRRLLRVPWTARRSSQSILKAISPGCSLEGLMLKLKLQTWPPDANSWLIWEDTDAGKDWRHKEKGMTEDEMVGWHHWLNGHEFE